METNTETEIELEVESAAEIAPESEVVDKEKAEEEFVVSIGEETAEQATPPEKLPGWMRALTKNHRNVVSENNRLRKEIEQLKTAGRPAEVAPKLRAEPTLEDHDFDSDKFKADLGAWYKEKSRLERDAEEAERARKQAEDGERQQWQSRLQQHEKSAKELPVRNYQEAEETVFGQLDQTQQGIVINYSDNSALLTYALHGNPAKLQDLAAIKDPGRFIREMTKLESQLKTSKRRPSTAPESRVEHVASGKPTTSNAGLEKLRAEAARTGNWTKVMQYKREMKQRAAK